MSKSPADSGRRHEFEIEIQASAEEVWRAVSEGDRITRWFAPIAEVTPGEPGKVLLSWGAGMEGEAPIRVWEPGRRFGWIEREESDSPRAILFEIEAAGGRATKLRLTHSGIGIDASFNSEFDSTFDGWRSFLALLRLDLERHQGLPARHVARMSTVKGDAGAVMGRITTALAFARNGQSFTATLPGPIPLSGTVLFEKVPGYLMLALEHPNPGALGLFAEACGAGQLFVTLSLYAKGEMLDHPLDQAMDQLMARIG